MPSDADESPSLLERITRWRNRLIATPEAQRWFFRLPLVRAIAQRRSRALFDLCAGFVYSQILDACVRLDIFAHLRDSPRTVETIAARAHLDFDSARRLLKAAAAIGLVRPLSGDRFALADLGAAVLGNPGLSEMIAHHTLFYEDLRDPVALLRAGAGERLSQFWAYTTEQRNEHALYSDLMAKSQAFLAEDVLDAYAFPTGRG